MERDFKARMMIEARGASCTLDEFIVAAMEAGLPPGDASEITGIPARKLEAKRLLLRDRLDEDTVLEVRLAMYYSAAPLDIIETRAGVMVSREGDGTFKVFPPSRREEVARLVRAGDCREASLDETFVGSVPLSKLMTWEWNEIERQLR